jgi:hypothetical protein
MVMVQLLIQLPVVQLLPHREEDSKLLVDHLLVDHLLMDQLLVHQVVMVQLLVIMMMVQLL